MAKVDLVTYCHYIDYARFSFQSVNPYDAFF